MKDTKQRTCPNCKGNFTAKHCSMIYCSTYCQRRYNRKKLIASQPKTKICKRCGAEFELLQNWSANYCTGCRKYPTRKNHYNYSGTDPKNRPAEPIHIYHIKKWYAEYCQKTTSGKAIEILADVTSRSTANITKILGGEYTW